MATRPRAGWVDQFPGNFMWSNALLVCRGLAPYGAVAPSEIDSIAAELEASEADAEAWWTAWSRRGAFNAERAKAAEAVGDLRSAGLFHLRAGNYYYTGERFTPPGEVKRTRCATAFASYRRGFTLRFPQIEQVEVPYRDGNLPGLFVPAASQGPAPTVLIFNGMDNCKEMSAVFAGLELAARGFNALSVDGPGQGETRRLRDMPARHDYEVPAGAAFNYLAARNDVDAERVIVLGYSFGGYYAARIAAHDRRFAAGVALTAGHWDLHAFQTAVREKAQKSSAQSNFQFRWVVGAEDDDAALEAARRFCVRDVAGEIRIPFLVTHGQNDRIIPVENAQKLYDAIPSGVPKAIRIFGDEEGGSQHAHVDDRQVGVEFAANWIAETLGLDRSGGGAA